MGIRCSRDVCVFTGMSHCSALPFKLDFGLMMLASSRAKGFPRFLSGTSLELRGVTSHSFSTLWKGSSSMYEGGALRLIAQ